MIGTRVSHYRITGRLGEGGMGVVYEAVDEVLGRSVALKFPSREVTASSNQLAEEARAASRLNHPNVAQIYEYSESIEGAFIAMELVRGLTLRDVIAKGRVDATETVRIVLAVAEALEEAHRQDLIHLDIKPGNIAISERGMVKVLDFGLAKALPPERLDPGELGDDPRTQTMNLVCRGTPCYMSPEQARGERLDKRSDLFSLGAVMYECLTGQRAFRGQSAVSALLAVVSTAPPAPSTIARGLPARLDAIVARLLEKDRDARYGSAGELAADLRAFPAAGNGPRVRRSRAPAMALGGLAVALIAGVGAWMFTHRAAEAPAVRQTVVLPFENTGPAVQASFADGMADVITGMVSGFGEPYWVVPLADVRRFGVRTVEAAERTLHADVVISGRVRREADAGTWIVTIDLARGPGSRPASREVRLEDNRPGGPEPVLRDALMALLQVRPERAARSAPQPAIGSYARFVQARGLLREFDKGNNLERAVAELSSITSGEPTYAPAQVAYGEACFRTYTATKKPEWLARADQAARRAAELNPNEPGVHLMLGRILRSTGQHDAAIAELKLELARDPAEVASLLQLAGVYESARRLTDAEATLQQAIRLRPSYFPAYQNLGILYMNQGKWRQAEEPLALVTKLAPDYSDGYTVLGSLEYYLDRLPRARDLFSKAIELKPGSGQSYTNRCGVEFYLGDMDAAAADCRKAVDLQPASPLNWGNLADVLVEQGRAREAKEAYQKAVELGKGQLALNPTNPDLLGMMAKAAVKAGDKALALSFAARAISQGNGVRVLYNAGKAYGLAGDCSNAGRLLKQAFDNGYPRLEAKRDPDLNRLRAAPLSCAVPPV